MAKTKQNSVSSNQPEQGKLKHPTLIFCLIGIVCLAVFLGQWLVSLTNSYFGAFVEHNAFAAEAAANMGGLDLTASEQSERSELEKNWDLFTSSRLRDEVSITARDGVLLHGYLYDEGSNSTVVVLPRFHLDGTADFLPGPWLNEMTGCNLLFPDPRAHGGSEGGCFGFGYLEQYDLAAWLEWAEQTLGEQTFFLWGEGTGANTILFAAANDLLPDNVAWAVAESPYGSLHRLAEHCIWSWYQLPAFPFLSAIEWKLAGSHAGYTVENLELAETLQNSSAKLPVFFLCSEDDLYILPEWTREVYESYPGPKEMISDGHHHGSVYPACQSELQELLFPDMEINTK